MPNTVKTYSEMLQKRPTNQRSSMASVPLINVSLLHISFLLAFYITLSHGHKPSITVHDLQNSFKDHRNAVMTSDESRGAHTMLRHHHHNHNTQMHHHKHHNLQQHDNVHHHKPNLDQNIQMRHHSHDSHPKQVSSRSHVALERNTVASSAEDDRFHKSNVDHHRSHHKWHMSGPTKPAEHLRHHHGRHQTPWDQRVLPVLRHHPTSTPTIVEHKHNTNQSSAKPWSSPALVADSKTSKNSNRAVHQRRIGKSNALPPSQTIKSNTNSVPNTKSNAISNRDQTHYNNHAIPNSMQNYTKSIRVPAYQSLNRDEDPGDSIGGTRIKDLEKYQEDWSTVFTQSNSKRVHLLPENPIKFSSSSSPASSNSRHQKDFKKFDRSSRHISDRSYGDDGRFNNDDDGAEQHIIDKSSKSTSIQLKSLKYPRRSETVTNRDEGNNKKPGIEYAGTQKRSKSLRAHSDDDEYDYDDDDDDDDQDDDGADDDDDSSESKEENDEGNNMVQQHKSRHKLLHKVDTKEENDANHDIDNDDSSLSTARLTADHRHHHNRPNNDNNSDESKQNRIDAAQNGYGGGRSPIGKANNWDDNIYARSYQSGTLTKQKYQLYGTHEAVKDSHRLHFGNQKHHKDLATAHVTKINREASCAVPKPRIERIQGDASKKYIPHCTILHRCSDDTGCCASDIKTCAPKRTEDVDLFFYVKSINSKQGTIERLTFQNHTECHCKLRSKDKSSSTNLLMEPALLRRATVLDCNCPKLFEKVLQDDGYCRCDCSSGNSDCDWLKRGMEHFSVADRKCILEGRCKPPTCEFGSYDKKHGRCPRKDDKLFSRSFD